MVRSLSAFVSSCVLLACAAGLSGQSTSYTGGTHARPLIAGPIDGAKLTVLAGNTHPSAVAKNDRGAVEESFPLDHMQLVLQRPAELEKELATLMQEQQQKGSAHYHKWLTAAQFGSQYGVSQSDVTRVSDWLTTQGFRVDSVAKSGMMIEFSGTAGQVNKAFHTEIHHLEVNGVKHISNMSDPSIPAALTSVVKGVHSLNDFMPHPMHVKKHTNFTYTYEGTQFQAVAPADLATIYNLNPAFNANITGAGQTIVVIEDTNVFSATDITTFKQTFGLAGYPGTFSQVHPTVSGGAACTNPGVVSGNEGEAELDAEWAAASAPGASVVLASCTDTVSVFGGLTALQNLINGSSVPQIVSISYGECEAENGSTANASYNNTYQQAAAEGVSVFVSSGDEGAASCDADLSKATHGIGVSGFASTPYNVSVGGTDYGDTYAGTVSDYWSTTNTSTYGSVLSYVPEIPWNDSCASQLLTTFNGFTNAFGSDGYCNSTLASNEQEITTASGSGGPSGCYSGSPATAKIVGGSCAGQPKPSWQSVLGNPSDNVRDIPDVSLFAANGVWNHYYPYCDSDVNDDESCSGTPDNWSGAGGTSFSSPILAGVQALINQATSSSAGTGNPNPRYYALGNLEFGSSGSASCNSTLGNGVGSTCVFYDVTQGDMDVNCTGTTNCYDPSGARGVLSLDNNSYKPAYGTQAGWDFATGLGTINAYNLIRDWTTVQTSTAVTSSLNPASAGQQVTYTATVTPDIGSTETGTITWSSNTGCAQSSANSGTATCVVTWPTSGPETVTASYSGDSNYAASTGSVTQQVNSTGPATLVSPSPSSTLTGPTVSFTWTAAAGANGYYLSIGSTGVGSSNVFNTGWRTGTSWTATGLPLNGGALYVRLSTRVGTTVQFVDYTYTAASMAVLTAPVQGSTLTSNTQTFTWNAVAGATDYALWIGTTGVGSHNLLSSAYTTNTSLTFNALPVSGGTVYVRLYTILGSAQGFADYTFTASSTSASTIISPAASTTLSGPAVSFTWTAATGASDYYLSIGSTGVGSNNVFNTGWRSGTSWTATGLPTTGQTLYVRLSTRFGGTGGTIVIMDYTYTAVSTSAATITSPSTTSLLTSRNVAFTWTPIASASDYNLSIGSTGAGSNNVFNTGWRNVTSWTATGMPTNGETLYVRLSTRFGGSGGTIVTTDYVYNQTP